MRTNTGQILYIPRIGQRADFQHPLMKGCLGWWPLTDGAGGIAKDLVGGNNGVQAGGVTRIDTELGRASSFDGVDGRLDVTNLGGHDPYTTATTLSMWCYLRSDVKEQYFFNKSNSAGTSVGFFGWITSATASGDLELKLYDTSSGLTVAKTFDGLATQILDRWANIVFISAGPDFTLASNLDVYVDGVLQTATSARDGDGFTSEEASGVLSIAGRTTDNLRNIDADFHNVRFWNRALSSSEVLELYQNPWAGLSMPSETRYFFLSSPPPTINPFSRIITSSTILNTSGKTVIRRGA